MMFDHFWRAVAIGIGATALMDLWAIFLNTVFAQPRPNWGLVGRWVWHLRDGKVFHDDIGEAAPYAHESALGWPSTILSASSTASFWPFWRERRGWPRRLSCRPSSSASSP
jgi:hypothetical protein